MSAKNTNIAIVGCGLIGASLAVLFTGNGCRVTLLSHSQASLERGVALYRRFFEKLVNEGALTPGQMASCETLLETTVDYGDLSQAEMVFECVKENLALKHDIYQKLESACPEDTIIASVSSAFMSEDLCKGMAHPERMLVAHPWNPPHLVPCVEVVKGRETTQSTVDKTAEILTSVHRKVVFLNTSVAGFIGNRLQHALFREATYLVEQNIATPEEIDDTIRYSFGPRYSSIGIFEHNDFVGLDMVESISSYLYPSLCDTKVPAPRLSQLVGDGEIGYKTGTGYLDWTKKDMEDFRERQTRPYFKFLDWDFPEETAQ